MKKIIISALALVASVSLWAQGAHDFKITEVFVAPQNPTTGYQEEYGDVTSWIEIENTSYTTHDIRNCFLTTDRKALDENLSAPEREQLMSVIQKGDERTLLKGKQRITFFADGNTNRGVLHTNFKIEQTGEPIFVALYDGNAVDLLDSITLPADMKAGTSYALINGRWDVRENEGITPDAPNTVDGNADKIKEWKEKDPYGLAMTVLSMGIVFGCLLLLFVFFYIFGWIINRMNRAAQYKAVMKLREQANKVVVIAKEGIETKGIEMENYVAAISLAMHEYLGGTHDVESGVITIQHHATEWESKDHTLRHTPEVHILPQN